MWIRTQNKQRIVNSDQIIDIFIDKSGTKIMAETAKEDIIVLGEYKDRDTCLDILEHVGMIIGYSNILTITMPLGGSIDEWKEGLREIARYCIVKDFR